jgi:HSP20 family protein
MAANGKKEQSAVAVRQRRTPGMWPEDFDRFFERAFRGPLFHRRRHLLRELRRVGGWIPDMDVFEREGKTVVRVDLPGMKREDVNVTVEKDMLLIRGHREEAKEVKEDDYYCSERATGDFSRGISLPEGVKAEQIEATYNDGVLEVVVPKGAAAEEKTVQVPVN